MWDVYWDKPDPDPPVVPVGFADPDPPVAPVGFAGRQGADVVVIDWYSSESDNDVSDHYSSGHSSADDYMKDDGIDWHSTPKGRSVDVDNDGVVIGNNGVDLGNDGVGDGNDDVDVGNDHNDCDSSEDDSAGDAELYGAGLLSSMKNFGI